MEIKFQTARIAKGKANVPSKKGLYMWVEKNSKEVVYIGIALSKYGLHRRINLQHLNPNYLEYRKERYILKDRYQIRFAVTKKTKLGAIVAKGIDKSVFRRAVGRKHRIKPGQNTVNFIIENYCLKFFCMANEIKIKTVEKMLINKCQPIYNTSHRS